MATEADVGAPSDDPIEDILAVIESAKAREGEGDAEGLHAFAARALPGATEDEVRAAADLALEIIESVPILLARAHQEAEERGLQRVALPLLERAERYWLKPIDLVPEMTQGLVGLLDDTYLVLRTLEKLDRGQRDFLGWDLASPLRFLRRLLGRSLARRLDLVVAEALEELSENLEELWARSAHQA